VDNLFFNFFSKYLQISKLIVYSYQQTGQNMNNYLFLSQLDFSLLSKSSGFNSLVDRVEVSTLEAHEGRSIHQVFFVEGAGLQTIAEILIHVYDNKEYFNSL
jgi:hypothetical protein